MSIQAAFQFIGRARREEMLRQQISSLGQEATLDRLIAIAAAAGFSFTAEELRQAHKYDWAMRWVRYHHGASANSPAP
jgi:predicted ribosomally synthesized peptide with nif11-like leader